MDADIRGKRKKKKNTCPNPLFVKWLTQWRDDAAERGMKSQYTYNKALSSLKKYPLPFSSGKECKVLENIGDKICKMLDTKLAEYIAEHGVPTPVVDSPPRKMPKPSKRTAANVGVTGAGPVKHKVPASVTSKSAHPHNISDDEDSPPRPKQRRRNHSSGEYVPAYRSGPYALLVTLYSNFQRGSGVGHLSKADLIREAQHLCDASFTIADPGSRYTAWSSMGTLIRKGLVIKESSPARYSITPAGCELAEKLKQVGEPTLGNTDFTLGLSTEDHQPPALPSLSCVTSLPVAASLPHTSETRQSEVITPAKQPERLCYGYVSEDGSTTTDKNKAAVTVDDSIGLGFLIKCNYQELLKSGKRYKLDISRPLTDDNMFAYLQDNDADDFACLPNRNPVVSSSKSNSKNDSSTAQDKSKATATKPQSHQKPPIPSCPPPSSSVNPPSGLSLSERLGLTNKTATPLPSTIQGVGTMPTSGQVTDRTLDVSPRFSFRPGTFDVVLCVDNQEFYGKTSSGGKTLLADLIKNGVNCDVRKLQVGDFLWVAREKLPPVPGQLGRAESREVVLDHIIERKRMDDLVSSCIDGRFREQKFRLKQCGLRCPLYLIEDYGSVQNFSMPEDRLKQTMANTQVVDGFQVKRTRDNKESVAYLTIMTRYLQSFYQSKTLHCYPADVLADISGPYSINDRELKLMEFKEFNEASVKTKNLSIREMFGKQMIQMYRLSAEGARAVLDHYPTPSHLVAAYDNCRNEKDKEELLSKIKSGKAGRCLGSASSRQFYQLYCTNQPLT